MTGNTLSHNTLDNSLKSVRAESALVSAGAHFVLCAPSKKPIWSGWNLRRPTAEVAALHRREHGLLGVIPWSLRSTGLDVDAGDPRQLLLAFGPWALIPSKRRGGRHAYYDDTESRANSKWAAFGCSGEVRGGRGYLILHNDGPELLAAALKRRVEGERPWPRDLFEMAGLPPVVAVRAPVPAVQIPDAELNRSPLIELAASSRSKSAVAVTRYSDHVPPIGPISNQTGLPSDWRARARVFAYARGQNELLGY